MRATRRHGDTSPPVRAVRARRTASPRVHDPSRCAPSHAASGSRLRLRKRHNEQCPTWSNHDRADELHRPDGSEWTRSTTRCTTADDDARPVPHGGRVSAAHDATGTRVPGTNGGGGGGGGNSCGVGDALAAGASGSTEHTGTSRPKRLAQPTPGRHERDEPTHGVPRGDKQEAAARSSASESN